MTFTIAYYETHYRKYFGGADRSIAIYMSLDFIKIFIGIITLIVAVFSLVKWYNNRTAKKSVITEEPMNEIAIGLLGYGQWLVGMCSGILTTSVGMPGVPLALYFSMSNFNKEIICSTTLAFFIVVYVLSIVVQVFTVQFRIVLYGPQ